VEATGVGPGGENERSVRVEMKERGRFSRRWRRRREDPDKKA
jgi:hypothetical protein